MVLFFGRIWPYKGLEYLIRAEPIDYLQSHPRQRLLLPVRARTSTVTVA